MWLWSQVPAPSQPAVVQALPSLSVQAVLEDFGGWLHAPVAVSQGRSSVHSLVSGVHTVVMWLWSQVPAPSQPAVVQALPSLSVQAVLEDFGGWLHAPV